MTPALQNSLRKHALPILCLTLAPIIVAIIHDDWLFTPLEYLDPWHNVGYFLHYFDSQFMPGHYKESRLSWLAPGALLYKIIGPLAANYVLHLGCLIAACVLVYLTLERLTSRNAAFLAAALLCAYYPFHNSGGWDYQTTPSGAYYALTLYLLTRAAQSMRAGPWLLGAGATFAATFHADILFINMAPALVAQYLVITKRPSTLKELAPAAGWSLLGFIILTQLLSGVALSAGRSAMFYRPIVDIVFNYTIDPHAHMGFWWLPTSSGWFLQPRSAAYLLPLAGVAVAGATALVGYSLKLSGRNAPAEGSAQLPIKMVLVGQFVFLFALWSLWQAVGHTALQPDYFAYPLIVPAFLALGTLAGRATWRELALLVASLTAAVAFANQPIQARDMWSVRGAYVWMIAATALAIIVGISRPKLKAAAVVVTACTYLAGYVAINAFPYGLWSESPPEFSCSTPRRNFLEVVRVNKLLHDGRPAGEQTWLWNGPGDAKETVMEGTCSLPLGYLRWALFSSGVRQFGATTPSSPEHMTDWEISMPQPGDRVAALVADPSQGQPLVARFARSGRTLAVEQRDVVNFGSGLGSIIIYDVKLVPSSR